MRRDAAALVQFRHKANARFNNYVNTVHRCRSFSGMMWRFTEELWDLHGFTFGDALILTILTATQSGNNRARTFATSTSTFTSYPTRSAKWGKIVLGQNGSKVCDI